MNKIEMYKTKLKIYAAVVFCLLQAQTFVFAASPRNLALHRKLDYAPKPKYHLTVHPRDPFKLTDGIKDESLWYEKYREKTVGWYPVVLAEIRGDLGQICNVGCLSRQEVVKYFSHSQAFWMPTTLEMLGLPFLEAMTMGVPILAPDLDFARYVCGEAALFYDPWNLDSILNSVLSISGDDSLRRKLVAKGKEELMNREKFAADWNEVALQVL